MKLMLAQNTAQRRAAARTEQQAQRRAAACKNPCADGKGAGESAPPLRAIIYE